MHCYPRMLNAREIYFYKFLHEKVLVRGRYNKSLKDRFLVKQSTLFPSAPSRETLRFSGNKRHFKLHVYGKEETWPRGTNSRLPFDVNVMLNLSKINSFPRDQS